MLGWELPPHYVGGMGLVCYQLCKHLASSGADIEFILPFTADFPDIDFMKINPALPDGPDTVLREDGGVYGGRYFSPTQNGQLSKSEFHQQALANYAQKLVLLGSYDVIHVHDWLTMRAGLAAKQASGLPLIVHVHATEFDRAGGGHGNPLVHEIEQAGLMAADRVIAISERVKQMIVKHYHVPADKVEVVHNAAEFSYQELTEPANDYFYLEAMKQRGYKVVAAISRLTLQKGLPSLLLAMKEVVARQPKAILLIAGGGDMYYELLNQAADLGIAKNVIFTNHLTGRALRNSFRVADLFVMPSVSEPFGITPLESLILGTPALISKQSGVSEVLNGCLKVDFWDVNEMANKISAVLDSPELAQCLLANGRQDLKRINWQPSAKKMMNIYETVGAAS